MSILNKGLLELRPNTVEEVRKEYNLDKPGMMDQAIDILHEWIQKQEHFLKKDFCREYLERVIISSKGSVERAKVRVDKMCTLRTQVPELFSKFNAKKDFAENHMYIIVYMPKLTEDNYRVFVHKLKVNITTANLFDGFRHGLLISEYIKRHDYAQGIIFVVDVRDHNITDLVAQLNITDMNNEGFGFRIKNIFLISSSKVIDLLVIVLKQVVSAKIGRRIEVVETVEDLHKKLPKELLPKDLGGQQMGCIELYEQWNKELESEENMKYLKEMAGARVDENLRQTNGHINEYFGIPGTFKSLTID